MHYEHKNDPLLPRRAYLLRLLGHSLLAITIIFIALFIGVAGYHFIGGLAWIDSLLNASMILGGMGPVDPLTSVPAKLFALFLRPLRRRGLPGDRRRARSRPSPTASCITCTWRLKMMVQIKELHRESSACYVI